MSERNQIRLPLLDVPEPSKIGVKYSYLRYSPDESVNVNRGLRYLDVSGSLAQLSRLPNKTKAKDLTNSEVAQGTGISIQDARGDGDSGVFLQLGNREEAMLNRGFTTISKELEMEQDALLELLQAWQSRTGLRGNPFGLFSEATGLQILSGLSESQPEGWVTAEVLSKWFPELASDVLGSAGAGASSEDAGDASAQAEPIWRVLSKREQDDSQEQTDSVASRLGVLIQVSRRPLYEVGEWTEEEPIFIRLEGEESSFSKRLPVLHGYDYKLTMRGVYYLEIFNAADPDFDPVTSPRFGIVALSRPRVKRESTVLQFRPAPPTDLIARWDYDERALRLRWSLPFDELGIVKRLQLFRRSSALEPFKLLREWDWNNNQVTWPREGGESPPRHSVQQEVPRGFFYDPDFKPRVGEEQHYALAVVTTHGISSPLSIQVTVKWLDGQRGVRNSLLSRSGAPKQHPNLLLENDAARRQEIASDLLTLEGTGRVEILWDAEAYKLENLEGETLKDYRESEFLINILDHKTLQSQGILLSTEEEPDRPVRPPRIGEPFRVPGTRVTSGKLDRS